jgi:predicted acetyltransferase
MEMKGIRLKTAEMGLVGTLKEHRGRGLMKLLNLEFDKTLHEEQFDIAVIQGIPGFYHKLGYHYAVSLENSINIPLAHIDCWPDTGTEYSFRLATSEDIPFLMKEDEKYRKTYLLSVVRQEKLENTC